MGMLAIFVNDEPGGNNGSINVSPPIGYKWRIKLAMTRIDTGTSTGTRTLNIVLVYGYSVVTHAGLNDLITNTYSTVSSYQNITMAPYLGSGDPSTQNYPNFEVSPGDALQFYVNGTSLGDTINMYLLVEELPDV